MIRDGIVHVFGSPAEPLVGDEVRCLPERPYLPAAGVRTVFHVDWVLRDDGDYECRACGLRRCWLRGERSAEA